MSRNKKNRNNNKNQSRVREINMPQKLEDVCAWYFSEITKDDSYSNIIGLMSVINARMLCSYNHETEDFSDDDKDFAADFVYQFHNYPWKNEKRLQKEMYRNWGCDPLVLRLGYAVIEQRERAEQARQGKKFKQFPIKIKQSVEAMCNFVFDQAVIVEVTVDYPNGEIVNTFYDPEDHEELKDYRKAKIRAAFIKMWNIGGAFTIAVVQEPDVRHDIYGGYIRNKHAEILEPKELQDCYEEQPDGTRIEYDEFVYQRLPLKLY